MKNVSLLSAPREPSLLLARREKKLASSSGGGLASLSIRREELRKTDQRREGRYADVLEEGVITFRRKKHKASVMNVSRNGAMITCAITPRIGEQVQIAFDECEGLHASVRWIRQGRIGLEFARETIIFARAPRPRAVSGRRAGEQRTPPPVAASAKKAERAPRQCLMWQATLYSDNATVPAWVRNISADGAMISGPTDLAKGTEVVLVISAVGTIFASVRWCRSGHIGLKFDQKLDVPKAVEAKHAGRATTRAPDHVKPAYLESENDPHSPWAARWDKLNPDDLPLARR